MYWPYSLALCVAGLGLGSAFAADQPQWGQAWSRNLVSDERGLPDSFDPGTGKNVKWSVELGSETHATPVIAGGRVYIGTNNGHPRDPQHQKDRGVLMCFEEGTGKFLWQLVVPKRTEDIFFDWPESGICSAPTIEGDRAYVVDNRGNVLCLDVLGMSNGNDGPFTHEVAYMTPKPAEGKEPAPGSESNTNSLKAGPLSADIIWRFDLTAEAGIWSHDAAHSSILISGNHLYLNTSTGVDNTHKQIRLPDAPNLVVLDKRTGWFLAREREGIGPNIFHNTWSPPSMAEVNGKPLIFLAAGNGFVYAFEPLPQEEIDAQAKPRTLKKVWQFDFDPTAPKTDVHKFNGNRRESPSDFFGLPVFHADRIYVAGGGDIWWGKNVAWLKCIDATGSGDITKTGQVWSYDLQRHVLASPAVAAGLVYIADCGPMFHCVDAATGKAVWTHELRGEAWASPFVADGKVYIGTRRGQFYVFDAGREKKILTDMDLGSPISSTATVANGTLYVTTMNRLYAVAAKAP